MAGELLTHSKRRDFLNCPRYYYLKHEKHLVIRSSKTGRRRGSIFGDALQAARDAFHEVPDMAEALDAAMTDVDDSYASAFVDVNSQEDMDELLLERAKVRVMVRAYIYRYGLTARREVEFELPYRHPRTDGYSKTWRLAGKIDGIEVVAGKRGRVIEDKFVGQIQRAMIERLPLDAQATEYVDALLSRGWEAEVAYRHTRFPGINPTKEKVLKSRTDPAETLEAFEVRLWEDVEARPDFYFDEQILFFPKVHLESYRSQRWVVGQMILNLRQIEQAEGMDAWPQNASRCWEYGGCEFIPLCTMQEGAGDRYVVQDANPELRERSGSVAGDEYGHEAQ